MNRPSLPAALPLVGALLWPLVPALAADAPAAKSVYRCEQNGRTVFQQSPCASGQSGGAVDLPPGNVIAAPPRPAAAASSAAATAPSAAPASGGRPQPAAHPLQAEMDACLSYLQPLLLDPQSGRILSAERDGRVLRVKLRAADARGRQHTRDAACEFINGRVDDGWSRIQLKRLGWLAPRVLVTGTDRESRKLARALEESIEKQP